MYVIMYDAYCDYVLNGLYVFMNKFCSVLFRSVPYSQFCMFMKRSDTNECTYNDTLVSQVTNTILMKYLKHILPMVEMEISLDE